MSNVASKAQALARKDRASSTLDQIAFFGAFILGTSAILGLKALEMPQVVVTSVPVLLMFVYLGYILWTRYFSLGDDRIGDNLYYLGFLFTLVSIAASLYEFTTTENAASRIIVNFGIALTTTIVGVSLRVTLMQVRGDPAEVERIARMELSEAALRLRSEVDIATQSMASVRIANEQAIAEATTNAVKSAMGAMGECTTAFAGTVSKAAGEMRAHFDAFSQNATILNKTSTRLVNASEKLCQKLEAIELPSDVIEKKLERVASRLDTSAASLENLARGIGGTSDGMSAATVALRANAASLALSSSELKRTTDELVTQGTSLRDLSARWEDLSRLVTNQQQILQSISTLGTDVDVVKRQREEIRTQVEQATRMLVDLESSLVSLARGLVERVNA